MDEARDWPRRSKGGDSPGSSDARSPCLRRRLPRNSPLGPVTQGVAETKSHPFPCATRTNVAAGPNPASADVSSAYATSCGWNVESKPAILVGRLLRFPLRCGLCRTTSHMPSTPGVLVDNAPQRRCSCAVSRFGRWNEPLGQSRLEFEVHRLSQAGRSVIVGEQMPLEPTRVVGPPRPQ